LLSVGAPPACCTVPMFGSKLTPSSETNARAIVSFLIPRTSPRFIRAVQDYCYKHTTRLLVAKMVQVYGDVATERLS
jgi:hypothetical protein